MQALEATWPAVRTRDSGPWRLREGAGGGKRVSAASLIGPLPADLQELDTEMAQPLVQVLKGQAALDRMLAKAGYQIKDRSQLYLGDMAPLVAMPLPRLAALTSEEPLAIQREIWAEGGIGPARLAVMARVEGPRTTLLGRIEDRPVGTAFAAIHDGVVMVHAIEVLHAWRRKGVARNLMIGAAHWAAPLGARDIAVAVTEANAPARALYTELGMRLVGQYHYRILTPRMLP